MKARLAAILAASPGHLDVLQAAALAGPRHAWIGAGFLRNAVWDALSGRAPDVAALADIDVVHHDADAPPDAAFEAALRAARPLPWSVVNQVRAHPWNGHAPYRDLADALAHWPETATAVAARLARGRIEILAPHGVDDLMGFVIRPTPSHAADRSALRARLAAKRWRERWPALRVVLPD
ncbi:nucleotidyltransferase family protein [Falsiroseomonas sp. HW251]|uniref:nucleotidyltransferase family protein n=1 Tax=Falsiroseomonas sp. HW251 TaxID=3390998 RepID=UPI003D320BBE